MGHLTKWLFFNLLFGAIPYLLTVALNRVQFPGASLLHPSSEVLFIAVVATSSALGELWERREHLEYSRSPWQVRWQLVMLVGVLYSSLLYGAYVYATLGNPGRADVVDCVIIHDWASEGDPADPWKAQAVRHWGGMCTPWARSQAMFFRWSLWTVGLWAGLGTFAMYLYPPQGGDHGERLRVGVHPQLAGAGGRRARARG